MNGTMVACLSCKQIVWAYDDKLGDVRGILNMMQIPCRLCGVPGNYDGWRVDPETVTYLDCPDAWQAMRKLAEINRFGWSISPNNVWFTEPKEGD